jgi:sugar/nucleoside kinase (ribokinase family)
MGSLARSPDRAPRVVVVGPVNIDLFMRGEAPLDREALASWVGPSDVQLIVAGSVGYTVQVFARLGSEVELCTTTGDDAFGAYLREALAEAGIGLRHSTVAAGPTAIAIYVLLFGSPKRPMTYRLPGFEAWPDPLPAFELEPPSLLHSGGLLHFPELWHRDLARAFSAARRAGALTSLDPQFPLTDRPPPWLPFLDDVLPHADVLLMDEGECRAIFDEADLGRAIDLAHAAGPSVVAVKRGAGGSVVSDGSRRLIQPAIRIADDQVREAVGAGDAYDAAFLDALIRGSDVATAARRATATAALSLRQRGGAEGIVGRDAVDDVLAEVPGSEAWPGS